MLIFQYFAISGSQAILLTSIPTYSLTYSDNYSFELATHNHCNQQPLKQFSDKQFFKKYVRKMMDCKIDETFPDGS